jgi:protein-S-isoprenylcysteine O-methyltransferase Ste14
MSFLIWVVSFALMLEFQVRLEEEYLLEKHGEVYINYCKKVRRYIPWIY